MNIQGWFCLGLTGLIFLQSRGLSRVFFSTTIQKHWIFGAQPSVWSNCHIHTWKNHSFDYMELCHQSDVSAFNTLCRFVIAFSPRCKCLLISWLQSLSAVILEPKKIKSVTIYIFSPSICHEVMGLDAMFSFFECWVLSQLFPSPLSLSWRGSLVPLCFLP